MGEEGHTERVEKVKTNTFYSVSLNMRGQLERPRPKWKNNSENDVGEIR